MTTAVCVNCGSIKASSFCSCEDCGFIPESELDMAYSLAITSHYFDEHTLNEISQSMKSGKPRPNLPPEQEADFINAVRDPSIKKMIGR